MDALLQYLGLDNKSSLTDTFIKYVKEFDFGDLILGLKKNGDLSSLIEHGHTVYTSVRETVCPIILSFSKMKVKKDSTINFEVDGKTHRLVYEKRKDKYSVRVGKYYFTVDDNLSLHCIVYKIRLNTQEDGHVCIKKNLIQAHEAKDRCIEFEVLRSNKMSQRLILSSASEALYPINWNSTVADCVQPIEKDQAKYKSLVFREHYSLGFKQPSRMELKCLIDIKGLALGHLAIGLYVVTGSKGNDFYPKFQAMSGTHVIDISSIAAINGTIRSTRNKNFVIDNELMCLVQSLFESYVLARERIGLQNAC